jgi:hypothetical protein
MIVITFYKGVEEKQFMNLQVIRIITGQAFFL